MPECLPLFHSCRPDRTEVLSEGLQEAEKRIDQIKLTCESTAKKVQACLQGQGKDGVSIDKRIVSNFAAINV